MKATNYIVFLLSCLLGTTASGQNIEFIENKGQWDPQVKYMGTVSAGAFFIHQDGFTVLQHDPQQWGKIHELRHGGIKGASLKTGAPEEPFVLKSHAYRMKFVNSNPSAKIIADKPVYSYNNYYIGNDPSKWATNCRIYQGITIKDVYPNVDARYYSENGGVKYDLIVNPGANINDIALKYDGLEKLEVKNRELNLKTSVGTLRELEPYSYQFRAEGKTEVTAKYIAEGNVVRLQVKNYDPKSTLVIDPKIIFCSFTGSTADNWGFSATYGPDGAMFGGGIVFNNGFPVSPGAFQTTFGGGSAGPWGAIDIGIMKLSPNGTSRIYATYIGGSGNEMPQSLVVDPQGNLVISGRTDSQNYPTTVATEGTGGGFDIILTKLNAAGGMFASRKIGGSGDDGANITNYGNSGPLSLEQNYGDEARSEVNLDAAGNIYLASCTRSANFPTTNAFQPASGGAQDGVVIKMNPNLTTVLFSTYFGGTGDDAAYVISLHPTTNQIYIGGGTASTNLPGSTAGSLGTSNQGSVDGFLSILSNNGVVSKTTYLGTPAIDQVYGVQFDAKGFPYVMGQTKGAWPVMNAAWSQPNGKQFIAKLQPDLSAFVYSTVFGKGGPSPDISPVAFLVDRCENVYISGWGGGIPGTTYPTGGNITGLAVTADAFKPVGDAADFYFFVLKKDAADQLFGSYFGQDGGMADHVDGGTSRFDRQGVIYQAICANCSGGATFPTMPPGVWSATNKSANCNLAMLKIDMDLAGADGTPESYIDGVKKVTGCAPVNVEFRDSVKKAESYSWNFGDSPTWFPTTNPTINHTYSIPGTFTVTLVAIDPTKCIPTDTSYLTMIISPDNIAVTMATPQKLEPCEAFRYQFTNTSTPRGTTSTNTTGFIWDFGDGSPRQPGGTGSIIHTFPSPGTYKVKLILNDPYYCNNPDSISIDVSVAASVQANFDLPPGACAPFAATFSNTSIGGVSYEWDFGDGSTSTSRNPSHTFGEGTFNVTLIADDPNTCNRRDTIQKILVVHPSPTAGFVHSTPSTNTPVVFTNQSQGAVRYRWDFGDGDSLLTTSTADVQHEYNKSEKYTACLTAYNQFDCPSKVCKTFDITVEPAVDVPNAFTPLSGDVNSKVFVRGYGIGKMKFIIWARWGEKVFETDNYKVGWDGRFKGQLLPMDVYAYTLDVEFVDGTKARKKGDITLIR